MLAVIVDQVVKILKAVGLKREEFARLFADVDQAFGPVQALTSLENLINIPSNEERMAFLLTQPRDELHRLFLLCFPNGTPSILQDADVAAFINAATAKLRAERGIIADLREGRGLS